MTDWEAHENMLASEVDIAVSLSEAARDHVLKRAVAIALRDEARRLIVHPSAMVPSTRGQAARFELRVEVVAPAVRVEV